MLRFIAHKRTDRLLLVLHDPVYIPHCNDGALAFGVPFWQLALSIGILILSFVGSTWIAGKIYRTGILMYGKKISWKEMMKWVLYKD